MLILGDVAIFQLNCMETPGKSAECLSAVSHRVLGTRHPINASNFELKCADLCGESLHFQFTVACLPEPPEGPSAFDLGLCPFVRRPNLAPCIVPKRYHALVSNQVSALYVENADSI